MAAALWRNFERGGQPLPALAAESCRGVDLLAVWCSAARSCRVGNEITDSADASTDGLP